MENIASQSFANLYIFVLRQEKVIIFWAQIVAKMVTFSSRNTNTYKLNLYICKLCEAIFSMFYNILPPNVAIQVILGCSF